MPNTEMFELIEASKLSLEDNFMQYDPEQQSKLDDSLKSIQRQLKHFLVEIIEQGMKDFWAPRCDPSVDKDGRICYQMEVNHIYGKGYEWWIKSAKEFYPERRSRIGTRPEWVAFLGVLIKKLVAEGKSVERAWWEVSYKVRQFLKPYEYENEEHRLEVREYFEVCGFLDLSISTKLLVENGNLWYAAYDRYNVFLYIRLMSNLNIGNGRDCTVTDGAHPVGWIIYDNE